MKRKTNTNISNVNVGNIKVPTLQKGITLISLVITIIILLILVSVAISLAVNADGLFPRAEYAKDEWNKKVAEEETEVQGLMDKLEEYVPLDEPEGERTLIKLYEAGELKIGDYVNYNPIAEGDTGEEEKYTYTSLGSQTGMTDYFETNGEDFYGHDLNRDEDENQVYKVNTDTKWRVLGTEGEGKEKHLLLISEYTVDKETKENLDSMYGSFYLYGAKGYLNCITELNNIGKIYGNGEGATGARSVNIDDINKITGLKVDEENYIIEPKNEDMDEMGIYYGQPYNLENQYTPQKWNGSKETSMTDTVTGRSSTYLYEIDSVASQTTDLESAYRLDALIHAYQLDDYWVAHTGIQYIGDLNCLAFGASGVIDRNVFAGPLVLGTSYHSWLLFCSDGTDVLNSGDIRPVVALAPNVTEKTIQKISNPV